MSLTTETHGYDGQIGLLYRQALILDQSTSLLKFEQAMNLVESWIDLSTKKNNPHLVAILDLLRSDPHGNYDSVNQIHVEELLPRVVSIVKDFESTGIDLFLQNLAEIHELGSCPQGRVTRLLGFYLPYVL